MKITEILFFKTRINLGFWGCLFLVSPLGLFHSQLTFTAVSLSPVLRVLWDGSL